ncbi:V-type proton ATPase subunit D 1 [Drosophila hydei]|uniref:V-type proton ATPase subunit D 1 n=1 Tax=Drosophila hydei TaxID=7224 RepID=A0A6J1LF04_DROHY|nr:V-type proton ATPase subunit D 1 [Drosophila hydei]
MSNAKIQMFPSRANAVIMNQKILAAKRGIRLLMRKRDAIDMKLRELRNQMANKEDILDDKMRKAIFSVTKANLLGTDFKPLIVTNSRVASTYLRKREQKIVGVTLNYFDLEITDNTPFPMVGLSCGGQQVQKVRKSFQMALHEIVEFASLEYMLRLLKHASHQTNMRVNALEYVVLPQLTATAKYINSELEEFEREDFYRLKRSQAKQLEAKLAFTELIKTRNMTEEELEKYVKRGGNIQHRADVAFDSSAFESHLPDQSLREVYLQRHSIHGVKMKYDEHAAPDPNIAEFLQRRVQRDPQSSKASFISLRTHLTLPSSSESSSAHE